jgi:hypothetical protein
MSCVFTPRGVLAGHEPGEMEMIMAGNPETYRRRQLRLRHRRGVAPPTRLPGGIAYYQSARHGLEVEPDTCRRELRKLVRRVDKVAGAARPRRQSSLPVVR